MISKFERAAALPGSDVAELAQMAALALEYSIKAEAGTATEVDLFTLTCHCSTLADDLYDLAVKLDRPPCQWPGCCGDPDEGDFCGGCSREAFEARGGGDDAR